MPTYLVWNKNQSHCSSAYARQTTQNIQTSKGGKHGARQPLDGITSASEPKHAQEGKHGAQQPIIGLTSASEPKHTQKGKRGARQPITGLTSASEPKTQSDNM